MVREALEREAEEQQIAIAQQNMEERWILKRHRDIANQIIDEERHAAVAEWAERRARVEEEIAHNAEAMRFQSELWRRGSCMPADAEQDIAATAPLNEEFEETGADSAPSGQGSLTKRASMIVAPSPHKPPTRHDVSKVSEISDEQQVNCAPEESPRLKGFLQEPSVADRIANLRRINRHLLQASEVEERNTDYGEFDAAPESIFQTEVGAQHISLSAYTPDSTQAIVPFRNQDDSDVVAAVCETWPTANGKAEVGTAVNLHEMRFKQQQEAEAVKRLLARRNCPFSAAVVDSALVMPPHRIKPEACTGYLEPNLNTEGMPDWYFQDQQKTKNKSARRKNVGRKSVAARRRGSAL